MKIDQIQKRLESIEGLGAKALNEDLIALKKNSLQISKVVKGLNFFSRNEPETQFESQSLLLILEDAISAFKNRFETQGIELIFKDRVDLRINCIATEISRVFFNLFENSCEAIEKLATKWISISIHAEANRILIYLTDSGSGLSSNVVANLMSPFFTTKESKQISGLGLSQARDIVEKHEGKLYYDSSASNSCFVIEFSRDQNYVSLDGQ